MNILAIDLGKFNSMVCFYNSDTKEHRFQLCKTERNFKGYGTVHLKTYSNVTDGEIDD